MDNATTTEDDHAAQRETWTAPRLEVLSMRSTRSSESTFQTSDSANDYS